MTATTAPGATIRMTVTLDGAPLELTAAELVDRYRAEAAPIRRLDRATAAGTGGRTAATWNARDRHVAAREAITATLRRQGEAGATPANLLIDEDARLFAGYGRSAAITAGVREYVAELDAPTFRAA